MLGFTMGGVPPKEKISAPMIEFGVNGGFKKYGSRQID